ncbi:MAG TPA: DUF4118 domain-containing protein [Bryobacteraceae bacterium]
MRMGFQFDANGLNRILEQLAAIRHTPARLLLSVAIAAAGVFLSACSEWILGSTAGAIFAVLIVLCTGLFGVLAGFCAVFTAVLVLDYFYLPPVFSFTFDAATLRAALGFGGIAGCTHFLERRITKAVHRHAKPALGMLGSFDGIENQEAYGWALDGDHPERPILVTAFVNGRPVAQVAAVHYRTDVAEKRKAGAHAFYVDLSGHLPPGADAIVDVRFPNGVVLPNAPQVVRVPEIAARKITPTVLFMHIPKTAGTAFREAIAANFLQSEIAYLYPDPPGFLASDLRDLPLEQLRAIRMVIGHFQFGMHERLPQDSEYITIVREPAARILSQYRFLQETQQPESKGLDLRELFENRLTVNFDNTMVRCFAGVDERAFGPGMLTSEHYETAVHNLHTAFAYVGHQETLDESYGWLCRRYGWQAIGRLPRVNVGAPVPGEPPAEWKSIVRHYNRWDCLLYEEICRCFPRCPGRVAFACGPE